MTRTLVHSTRILFIAIAGVAVARIDQVGVWQLSQYLSPTGQLLSPPCSPVEVNDCLLGMVISPDGPTLIGSTGSSFAPRAANLIDPISKSLNQTISGGRLDVANTNSDVSIDQINDDFQAVPCKNSDRQSAVKSLFVKMGAAPSAIAIHGENVVIRKSGTSEGVIVVGAHYDKVHEGCGAFDNWTGVVAVAHMYRSLKKVPLKKTVLFVGFGKEEEGLVGSRAMVEAIKKDERAEYCAMINIDSLGLAPPQIMDNASSRDLQAITEALAKEMKIPFGHAGIPGADADSSSFLRKKIPAVTIHGMSNDWPKILHSVNDRAAKVNPASVYLGYRLALALLTHLDKSPCDKYKR